jgi:RNA polymerase sigma-70 factor (ECF subfamily)
MIKMLKIPVILMLFLLATAVHADDVNLTNAPPVVVKADPQAGADNVDPSLTEIKVTFSKDMTDGSWSWSTAGKDNFPEVTAKPHYLADKRTCVAPVKLKPGKTYAIWLNSENFGNFKDADGRSAVPYLLVFKTKDSGATTKPSGDVK